jgi:hypothetical protein
MSDDGHMYRGWASPLYVLRRLQTAVRIIMEGRWNFRVRMDKATYALVGLRSKDFPNRLRGRATKVLGVRSAVAQQYATDTLYHFEWLKPKERLALIGDIIALYEGCLLDVARCGDDYYDSAYPIDR